MVKKVVQEKRSNWPFVIMTLIFLTLLAFIFAGMVSLFSGDVEDLGANVALIPVKGVIMADPSNDFFGYDIVSSTELVQELKKAGNNPHIKAIIIEINSPGGSAVASDEIGLAIKKVNKTTVAWVREGALSGGYWIASATDHIIANRISLLGSVGVIGSYLEFGNFLDEYNITYRRLVSGKYKDIGTPLKEMTESEEIIMQKKLNMIHEIFIDEVTENRGLSRNEALNIKDAEYFLGIEALDLNLIDELGSKEDVLSYIEDKHNITAKITEYKKKKTLLEALSEVMTPQSFFVGRGIASEMFSKRGVYDNVNIFT